MTFIEYLRTLKQPDTAAGDFIGDVLRDRDFPAEIRSGEHLAIHLAVKGACDEAHQAAQSVWRRYEKHLEKAGKAS